VRLGRRRQPAEYPRTIAQPCTLDRPSPALDAAWRSSALYPAALALAVVLPFDAIPALISTPWLSLTDDKLALLIVVAAWLLLGKQALPTSAELRALLPTLSLVLVSVLSAALAPADYLPDAQRFIARLLAAGFVLLLGLRLGRDAERTTGLLWAVALGGGASALLGLGEALRWPALEPILSAFKVAPTRVGGELRVSASFEYATIAAMYFEMVAPLAIVLSSLARRRWLQLLGTAIAMVCTANVVLSLTRAGLLTLAVIDAALLLAASLRPTWRSLRLPTLASAGVLVGGAALLLVHNPVFDLRLVTESDADWYGASYSAPATLRLQANQTSAVDVEVRNTGRMTWTAAGAHPFALGYRWLTADGEGMLDLPATEAPLSHDVEPGQTIDVHAELQVPDLPGGAYRLAWGMLQDNVLRFSERGWADAETQVQVDASADGPAATMPGVSPRDDDQAPWVVGRLDLWTAAARLIRAHPLLGVGPDNFRHFYGAELGLETWDERVQANNLYLEVLADLGVIGLAVFAWVLARPRRQLARALQATNPARRSLLAVGVGLAVAAFLLHGTLDAFLAFTPTALLFWLLLGLAMSGSLVAMRGASIDEQPTAPS
jgi:O-antigen ligase